MPQTTGTEHRTNIIVPKGTTDVLSREVMPATDGTGSMLARKGLYRRKLDAVLRYDLTEPDDVAGAAWLAARLSGMNLERIYGHSEEVYAKRDVLRRIRQELREALRSAEVAG